VPRTAAALLLLAASCADEEILHGLDESQANQVLLALADADLHARKAREEGAEPSFAVALPAAEASLARRVLSARDLPRTRAPGFSDLFGKPALVPTPVEERARYLHALQGELSRTLETLDGVVAARVHLALPAPDPLRPEARPPPRASVLLKCRPEARARLEALGTGIRSLVAGAADGLEPVAVSVVLAEAGPAPASPPRARGPARPLLAAAAASSLLAAGLLAAAAWRRRRAGSAPS
jgi:type III secretion protein J